MSAYQSFAVKSAGEAMVELQSSVAGLSSVEALRRLAATGPNEIVARDVSAWDVLRRQAVTSLNGLLVVAAVIAAALGEAGDAITIGVILILNTILGFFQEFHSEHTVAKLKHFLAGTARVRRAGSVAVISRRELVPGDIVMLEAGDVAPADLKVITATGAFIDQSVLSGESEPVSKDSRILATAKNPQDATDIVFSGTTVTGGSLTGVVFATGQNTEFGRIAELAATTERRSGFEEDTRAFSRFIMLFVAGTLTAIVAVRLFLNGSLTELGELVLFALALAVSVVPEALPVVMTITFSRGAAHLASRNVVVKRLSAIEDLGRIEVLCTDKTGTITENKLRVTTVFAADEDACLLAAGQSVEEPDDHGEFASPFDRAVVARLPSASRRTALGKRVILGRIPFDHERRRSGLIIAEGSRARLVVKGAPEQVLPVVTGLGEDAHERILKEFAALGKKGYRVLGIAERFVTGQGPWSSGDERDLTWLGLVAFEDPLKPTAKDSIARAQALNVRVKILTGDSPDVAAAVALDVGIVESLDEVITGPELDALDAEALAVAAWHYDVFARVTPEQKYRILNSLEHRAAVGFLGEGVNDAPALKLANVSLAVMSAADVSKDAADAILLDRSLRVIVNGIQEGRVIVSNVAKYIRYTLAGNFGNFLSLAAASLFLPFLPMLPIQILLTNLLTDLPLIAIATDRVDPLELDRPRRFHVRDIVLSALVLGLVSVLFDFVFIGLYHRAAPATVQTLWFIFSILTELATIFIIRTSLPIFRARPPSLTLFWMAAAAGVVAVALPFVSWGERVFHFIRPTGADLLVIAALVAGVMVATEAVKLLLQRFVGQHGLR